MGFFLSCILVMAFFLGGNSLGLFFLFGFAIVFMMIERDLFLRGYDTLLWHYGNDAENKIRENIVEGTDRE